MIAQQATGSQVAETLAELKAQKISRLHLNSLVIGADQVLSCGNVLFDKPTDKDHAKAQLMALAGKEHRLESTVCLVFNGDRLWHHNEAAVLKMRALTMSDIDRYLTFLGDAALESVGCYRIEKEGAYLLEKITGDPYVIQGMPLIPLIRQLSLLGQAPLQSIS